MCGIIAILSKINNIEMTIKGIRQLQNRGYDSFGVSYFSNKKIITKKDIFENNENPIDKIYNKIKNLNITNIISHTRWATNGDKSILNSHPHTSQNKKISIVHNGIIENYLELRKFLFLKGIKCISDTDSEVITNLISYYYKSLGNIVNAINHVNLLLKGSWAIVLMCRDYPNKLFAISHKTPLLLGYSDDILIFSSEISGFNNYIKSYFVLQENKLVIAEKNKNTLVISDFENYTIKPLYGKNQSINLPKPYTYWLEKEINDQYKYAKLFKSKILKKLNKVLINNSNQLKLINNIILLGCGTSFNAGLLGKYYLKNTDYFYNVQCINASDFSLLDISKIGSTCVIVLSQSGETKDVISCLNILPKNILTLGIVNSPESTISRKCNTVLYINVGREISVASTKSFFGQVLFLQVLANFYYQFNKMPTINHGTMVVDIKNMISYAKNNLNVYLDRLIADSMFILGKGKFFYIAREAALKIKEITYIHAEGYSGSALKHGPYSLLKKHFPVILFIMNDEHQHLMLNGYHQIIARGAFALVITDNPDLQVENKIIVPTRNNELLSIIIIQYISYFIGLKLGLPIDRPRNLAKCVTTD